RPSLPLRTLIPYTSLFRSIEEPREPLLERVDLFDLFTTNVGAARKSLAYRLTYRDRSRTLTNEEVNAAHAKIRERLRRNLGAELDRKSTRLNSSHQIISYA